jgi:hypothetical protein
MIDFGWYQLETTWILDSQIVYVNMMNDFSKITSYIPFKKLLLFIAKLGY